MGKITIKIASEEEFFKRGKNLAKLVEAGKCIPHEIILSFEEPVELLKLLAPARLALFHAVKERPDSITGLSQRLHRDRSAVKRDVDILVKAGLVTIQSKLLPGHGIQKEVHAKAGRFTLEAVLA